MSLLQENRGAIHLAVKEVKSRWPDPFVPRICTEIASNTFRLSVRQLTCLRDLRNDAYVLNEKRRCSARVAVGRR